MCEDGNAFSINCFLIFVPLICTVCFFPCLQLVALTIPSHFLQKKGWFGVEQGKNWGTGSKGFMRDLFERKIIPYKNFFKFAVAMLKTIKKESANNPIMNVGFINTGLTK